MMHTTTSTVSPSVAAGEARAAMKTMSSPNAERGKVQFERKFSAACLPNSVDARAIRAYYHAYYLGQIGVMPEQEPETEEIILYAAGRIADAILSVVKDVDEGIVVPEFDRTGAPTNLAEMILSRYDDPAAIARVKSSLVPTTAVEAAMAAETARITASFHQQMVESEAPRIKLGALGLTILDSEGNPLMDDEGNVLEGAQLDNWDEMSEIEVQVDDMIEDIEIEDLNGEGMRRMGYLPANFDTTASNAKEKIEQVRGALVARFPKAKMRVNAEGEIEMACPRCNSAALFHNTGLRYVCLDCDMEFRSEQNLYDNLPEQMNPDAQPSGGGVTLERALQKQETQRDRQQRMKLVDASGRAIKTIREKRDFLSRRRTQASENAA